MSDTVHEESFSVWEATIDYILCFLGLSDASVRGLVPPSQLGEPLLATRAWAEWAARQWPVHPGQRGSPHKEKIPRLWQSSTLFLSKNADGWTAEVARVKKLGVGEKEKFLRAGVLPVSVRSRRVVEVIATMFDPGGRYRQHREFFDEESQKMILRATSGNLGTVGMPKAFDALPSIGMFHAFAIPQIWTVGIGYVGGARIRFPTDPTGVLSMFRDRNKPDDGSRRPALLHWVSEHYRKSRVDPEAEILVREHLRGTRDFHWNGMICRVHPAEIPLTQLPRG